METHRHEPAGPIWAITTYFNPVGYQRRLWNYRCFRHHLSLPLLTIEFGWQGKFDLSAEDADWLIQLEGPDMLWQRERLLNLAMEVLPSDVAKLIWLDCDVLFEGDDWIAHLDKTLDVLPFAQGYSEVVRLPQQARPAWQDAFGALEGRRSLCSRLSPRHDLRTVCRDFPRNPGRVFPGPTGFGWAFRRDVVEEHGFYDVNVLGGGDILFISALAGCLETAIRYHAMTKAAEQHYRDWAEPLHRDVNQQVGCLPGRLYHLWHGDVKNRGYQTRYHDFQRFDFDPETDLAFAENGVWQWGSEKPELHQCVRDYFFSRCEDG